MSSIADVLQAPRFQEWEVRDAGETVGEETASQSDQLVAVFDKLHRAAFKVGLGNSLFCDGDVAEEMSPEVLRAYLGQALVSGNIVLSGANVQLKDLVTFGEKCFGRVPVGQAANVAGDFFAGEARCAHYTAPQTAVALGFKGVSAANADDVAASLVLRELLGGCKNVKWGSGHSRLARAASAIGGGVSLDAFALHYRQTGLSGVLVRAPSSSIAKATEAALAELRAAAANAGDAKAVATAKAQAKASVLRAFDSLEGATAELAATLSSNNTVVAPAARAAAIDKVTPDQVAKLAAQVFKGKFALAVKGDVAAAPMLAQLN